MGPNSVHWVSVSEVKTIPKLILLHVFKGIISATFNVKNMYGRNILRYRCTISCNSVRYSVGPNSVHWVSVSEVKTIPKLILLHVFKGIISATFNVKNMYGRNILRYW